MARQRWFMTGPWPHPKSGILYFRKATPKDIRENRFRLVEIDPSIRVANEVHESLKTRDRKAAEVAYKIVSVDWETKWKRWRELLRNGPVELDRKNTVALAGEKALAFLKAHERNPHLAPTPRRILQAFFDNVRWHYARRSLRDGHTVFELGQELMPLGMVELTSRISHLLASEPDGPRREVLLALIGLLSSYRGTIARVDARSAARRKGLAVTKASEDDLTKMMAKYQGMAWDKLKEYFDGDYRPPTWAAGLPTFRPVISSETASPNGELSVFSLLDHKAKTQSIKAKTVAGDRSYLQKFTDFVGHKDARRVTKDDVRRWRDSLRDGGQLSAKTINDKYLSALRGVLSYGVREFDLPANVASDIRDRRDAPAPVGSKGYSDAQAIAILKATFDGSAKELSVPHKRAIRWVPWILAYTGLRVSEVTQFRGANLSGLLPVYRTPS